MYQFSLPRIYISLLKGWENALFELGSERVNELENVSASAFIFGTDASDN